MNLIMLISYVILQLLIIMVSNGIRKMLNTAKTKSRRLHKFLSPPKSNVCSPKQRVRPLLSFYNFHPHFTGDESIAAASMVVVIIVVMDESSAEINLSFMLHFLTWIALQNYNGKNLIRFIFQAEIKQPLNLVIIVFIVVGVFRKQVGTQM